MKAAQTLSSLIFMVVLNLKTAKSDPQSAPQESSCSCNGFVSEEGGGECQTSYRGKRWCYITTESRCADAKQSQNYIDQKWSTQACQTNLRNTGNACTCNGLIYEGKGECKTRYKGRFWCYIGASAACSDKIESTKVDDAWSYQACQASNNGNEPTPEVLPPTPLPQQDSHILDEMGPRPLLKTLLLISLSRTYGVNAESGTSYTGGDCPKERGYCVLPNGHDQNSGVIKLDSVDGDTIDQQAECLLRCRAYTGATGCEVIWDQGNRGCYVHTHPVARGNNEDRHACWIFSKCKGDKAETTRLIEEGSGSEEDNLGGLYSEYNIDVADKCCFIVRSPRDATYILTDPFAEACSGGCAYKPYGSYGKSVCLKNIRLPTCCSYSTGALCQLYANRQNEKNIAEKGTCSDKCQEIANYSTEPSNNWFKNETIREYSRRSSSFRTAVSGPDSEQFDYDDWSAGVELNEDGSQVVTNIGEIAFNSYFGRCPVIQYTRDGAVYAVYVRTTPVPPSFNAFTVFTSTWASSHNQINVDFKLYDSLEDAKGEVGAWAFCNYDDPGVGFPRDCGKAGAVGGKWFSIPGGRFQARGSGTGLQIFTGSMCPAPLGSVDRAVNLTFAAQNRRAEPVEQSAKVYPLALKSERFKRSGGACSFYNAWIFTCFNAYDYCRFITSVDWYSINENEHYFKHECCSVFQTRCPDLPSCPST